MSFARKFWCGAVVAAFLFTGAAPTFADDCARWYVKLGRGIAGAPRWLKNQQKNYWLDVWNTRGRRLILTSRTQPGFNFWYFVEEPYSEGANYVNHRILKRPPFKYQPSQWVAIPASMFIGGGAVMEAYFYKPLDEYVEDEQLKAVIDSEERNPAGAYLLQLYQQGVLEPADMIDILKKHAVDLRDWIGAKRSDTSVRRRIAELKKLGILNSQADADKFEAMLRETFITTLKKHPPSKTDTHFVSELDKAVRENIVKIFPKASKYEKELLVFALLPEVKILDKSDLALAQKTLGSKVFAPIAEEFGLPLAMITAAASEMEKDGEIPEKKKKAEKVPVIAALPKEKKTFLERVDVPQFGEEIALSDFHGNKQVLRDELDRWRVFLTDRRFANEARWWRAGKISDIQAMSEFQDNHRAYELFYEAARRRSEASQEDVCDVVAASKQGGGLWPIFYPIGGILKDAAKELKFEENQKQYCFEELVRLGWKFQRELEAADGKTSKERVQAQSGEIVKLVNESCTSKEAKAFQSQCK